MAKITKTSAKRPIKPFKGAVDGIAFTKDNQPSPEAKKAGWERWRSERHITQGVLKRMLGDDGLPTPTYNGFMDAIFTLAGEGNQKAIDVIMKCMEEDVLKIAQTNTSGEDVTHLSDTQFEKLLNAVNAPSTDTGQ